MLLLLLPLQQQLLLHLLQLKPQSVLPEEGELLRVLLIVLEVLEVMLLQMLLLMQQQMLLVKLVLLLLGRVVLKRGE